MTQEDTRQDRRVMENYFGPMRKEIIIMGRRGPSNPTPDNETDTYWIDDYWFAPAFFDIEFIGENEKWDDKFVEGEMGALKRYLLHMSVQGQKIGIDPFSIYVCIENLQKYYKRKLNELDRNKSKNNGDNPQNITSNA
jgi:hypothetical protein